MTLAEEVCPDWHAVIHQAAQELGGCGACVLLLSGGRLEIVQGGRQGAHVPAPEAVRADLHRALEQGRRIEAGTVTAFFLRDVAVPDANSFMLFTRRVQNGVVVIALGFGSENPPFDEIPRQAAARLDLAAHSAWSSRQLNRLQAELRVVNQKLAGRKLVERAKAQLQAEFRINEPQAYEHLRRTSRRRRITIVKLAEEVLRKNNVPRSAPLA